MGKLSPTVPLRPATVAASEGRAVALMRDSDTRISHLCVDQIFEAGLHEFLVDFLARNNAIARAIAGDYRFHA